MTQPYSLITYPALALSILLLSACVSNEPKPITTSEHFTSQINAQGEVEFAFGLKWLNDLPQQPLRQGRDGSLGSRQRHVAGDSSNRFNQQPNNQIKLELEDKAAINLQKTLEKNQLCPHGYEVEQVIWEYQRIRLMGKCLTD